MDITTNSALQHRNCNGLVITTVRLWERAYSQSSGELSRTESVPAYERTVLHSPCCYDYPPFLRTSFSTSGRDHRNSIATRLGLYKWLPAVLRKLQTQSTRKDGNEAQRSWGPPALRARAASATRARRTNATLAWDGTLNRWAVPHDMRGFLPRGFRYYV